MKILDVAYHARRRGEKEAWDLALKIFKMSNTDFFDIFKTKIIGDVFKDLTAWEAKEKIEEWEKKQEKADANCD